MVSDNTVAILITLHFSCIISYGSTISLQVYDPISLTVNASNKVQIRSSEHS